MLSPYPAELVPFEPVDGPDTSYSQINKPIQKAPFIEAGLKGFEPYQPFKPPANLANVLEHPSFYWPSLSELTEEMGDFPWLPGEEERVRIESYSVESFDVLYNGPPPTAPPAVSFTPFKSL